MAKIVFGMAVPHRGMFGRPPEVWPEDGQRDRAKGELWYHNRTWTFAEVVEERKDEHFKKKLTIEERTVRSRRCTAALMTLVDYVPCCRTEVGTGEGMGFMYWSKQRAA